MSETTTWPESSCPSQEELALARNEIYFTLEDKPIWSSITFDSDIKMIFGNYLNKNDIKDKDIDSKYKNAHFLYNEHDHHWWNRTDFQWLNDALEVLAINKNEKILLLWWCSIDHLSKVKSDQIDLFLSYPNTEFKQLPFHPNELLTSSLEQESISISEKWTEEDEYISNKSIIESLKFIGLEGTRKKFVDKMIKSMYKAEDLFDEKYLDAVVIMNEHQEHWWNMSDFKWLDQAIEILAQNPLKTIILCSWLPIDFLKEKAAKFWLFQNYKNTEYKQLPINLSDCLIKQSIEETSIPKKEKNLTALISSEASRRIWYFRHALKHDEDPYNKTENEKVDWLKEVQKFFPWLETFEKAMDYVLHIKLDLPEPMKWKRIEWVYVDVDGTLIVYVGIHSGKEGTQELRQDVVELLKKYESEWKEIIIWTGWDVELKKKYLRSLWITRPVVSKYDYAGATAEIVLDDTDQNAFIAQSKIYPETYINTVTMWTK